MRIDEFSETKITEKQLPLFLQVASMTNIAVEVLNRLIEEGYPDPRVVESDLLPKDMTTYLATTIYNKLSNY